MPVEAPHPAAVVLGELLRGGEPQAVSLAFASRLSLYVAFSGPTPADGTVFEGLRLTVGDKPVELSRCRLQVEYTRKGFGGRLVFLDDVYDCHALLAEGRLMNLRGFFQGLPLVLGQKERVLPAFRDFTADALYDLAVYKRFFNEQDRILANEPRQVAEAAQDCLLRTEGREFFGFLDRQLKSLGELVAGFDKEAHERHGYYFRRQAWEFILGSEFLRRTNLKPRGYAGDAEMMQMCYENAYRGDYVFHKLMHKHPLETPAAQGVRNRRHLVPQVLREVRERIGSQPDGVRLLSVACGPASELEDIFLTADDFRQLRCSLLDQDPYALAAARKGIERLEAARDGRVQVTWLHDSVRTMLRGRDLAAQFGRHHLIYSMGLFDYLTPPVARAILSRLYELLLPGGTLLVGNFHVDNPSRFYMEYWMDWVLYYRTEAEFLELAAELPGARARVFFEETRCQMFLAIDRVDGG